MWGRVWGGGHTRKLFAIFISHEKSMFNIRGNVGVKIYLKTRMKIYFLLDFNDFNFILEIKCKKIRKNLSWIQIQDHPIPIVQKSIISLNNFKMSNF